ncbi:IS630 family transposase [Candidatus Poribacteria bacterium]|nr:IS630 family transposase [Candidatus Poribacteria bacterium]
MPQKLQINGPATPEEVTAARRTHPNPHDPERLIAIQMAQQGRWKIAEIATALGRGPATIGRWLKKFRHGGIPKLLKRDHGARQAQLDAEIQEALRAGLKEGQWKTAQAIRHWLKAQGKTLSLSGVYSWLKKVRAGRKLPRKRHAKQDLTQVEAFRENVVHHLLALEIPPDKRVRVWILDEHRYGLISTVRRCWTLKGHQPTAPVQMKYQWGSVYGAAEVCLGEAQFLFLPPVSLDHSRLFLGQWVDTDPEAIHIVFWDQAGFHQKPPGDPTLPKQVRLIPLPPYSPELNAITHLWDSVKRDTSNAVWQTLEAIESAITEVLKPFWECRERVWSLLGDGWLTRGVSLFLELRKAII